MNEELKLIIKQTRIFQRYKANKVYAANLEHYKKLAFDERALNRRICYLTGKNKMLQYSRMFRKINVTLREGERFQSWIDTGLFFYSLGFVIDNNSPDYTWMVDHSIDELMLKYASEKNEIYKQNYFLLQQIKAYIDRILLCFDKKLLCVEEKNKTSLKKSRSYFVNMKTKPAETVEEALQRILFWSDLFWQSGHKLIGIGRLDKILSRFPVPAGDDLDSILVDFYHAIHRYYAYKSSTIAIGDTGQIIVLGGIEPNGSYYVNEYTYQLIRSLENANLPDPKILLRVSDQMPKKLLETAVHCIGTGIGSPLLSNDDVVIPALEQFGYSHDDACNYVTSACWEPLAYGKSLEKNNIASINYAEAIVRMYEDNIFLNCKSFDDVLALYFSKLETLLSNILKCVNVICWEREPLFTLFTQGCADSGKDISEGGAIYNNYGVLTDGMGNAVNSLLGIKHLVFEEHLYTLDLLQECGKTDYEDKEDVRTYLTKHCAYFGKDDKEVIEMANSLTEYVYKICCEYRNKFKGKIKWGISSSNYLEFGKKTRATLDGRKSGEALSVHISSNDNNGYTELVNFASQLNYAGQRSNGNVVDYFVSPDFIFNNFEKFVTFIFCSIKAGFFQMQMNVVSSDTLIRAKENPEKFPNLIVRVWGFSAYFRDLPVEYQDLLIKRAMQNERGVR